WELANGAIITEAAKLTFAKIRDGLSNTIFVGEKHINVNSFSTSSYDTSIYNSDSAVSCQRIASPGYLLAKSTNYPDATAFCGPQPGVVHFLFGDGSVRPVSVGVDGVTLGRLAQRNDGQPVDLNAL